MRLMTLLLTGSLLIVAPAFAHDAKPMHGGRAVLAGNYHVELVARGDVVEVFLMDHNNKPMSLAGYKGVAILAAAGKSERIALEPVAGESLTGKASVALPANPKGVVQITPLDGKTVQAKFN